MPYSGLSPIVVTTPISVAPSQVMRIREPKATGMIFSSGKLVITGANGVRAAEEAGRKFVAVVKNQSLKPQFL